MVNGQIMVRFIRINRPALVARLARPAVMVAGGRGRAYLQVVRMNTPPAIARRRRACTPLSGPRSACAGAVDLSHWGQAASAACPGPCLRPHLASGPAGAGRRPAGRAGPMLWMIWHGILSAALHVRSASGPSPGHPSARAARLARTGLPRRIPVAPARPAVRRAAGMRLRRPAVCPPP